MFHYFRQGVSSTSASKLSRVEAFPSIQLSFSGWEVDSAKLPKDLEHCIRPVREGDAYVKNRNVEGVHVLRDFELNSEVTVRKGQIILAVRTENGLDADAHAEYYRNEKIGKVAKEDAALEDVVKRIRDAKMLLVRGKTYIFCSALSRGISGRSSFLTRKSLGKA